jgi:hypothetical protein
MQGKTRPLLYFSLKNGLPYPHNGGKLTLVAS